ncbi:MAG: glutamate racemase [Betaproteobacteria bacterium]|nr:glutamate racemase [Betaproteobacteria bacterium]
MRPIGVFDSGIGGLSVLQALQAELPHERFVYLADTGHAPYGEKSETFVRQRSLAIAQHLIEQHHIKALVVACNTATAAAIHVLRSHHPQLVLVGVEPALKPATQLTRTGRVGVMATQGTVGSEKFQRLLASMDPGIHFEVKACNGLALAIEQSTLPAHASPAQAQVGQLLQQYVTELGPFGPQSGHIDTLVLGCTHYVFAQEQLQQLVGPGVRLISTGEPVARQTHRLLQSAGLLSPQAAPAHAHGRVALYTTGDLEGLKAAAQRWLGLPGDDCHAAVGV